MKRKEFTKIQESNLVRMYTEERIGVIAIGLRFRISRTVVKRILNSNGVSLRNMVDCHIGQKAWNRGKQWNKETRQKIRIKSQGRFGNKNPNWKGGKEEKRDKRRNLGLVQIWRKKCLELDNHECRWCQSKERLEVNHIIPIRQIRDINLLGDVNNGITLCRKCHNKIHYHEHEYTDFLRNLLKNRVNSGNIL